MWKSSVYKCFEFFPRLGVFQNHSFSNAINRGNFVVQYTSRIQKSENWDTQCINNQQPPQLLSFACQSYLKFLQYISEGERQKCIMRRTSIRQMYKDEKDELCYRKMLLLLNREFSLH